MSNSKSYLSYIPLVAALVLLQSLLTPQQMLNQLLMMTSWQPFWHTNTCLAANCAAPLGRCVTNYQCMKTVGCVNTCMLDNLGSEEKVAACAYLCEMTHGYENQEFEGMMGCMLDSGCLLQYPEDGPCVGDDTDALESVKTMEDIEGDWWVLRGINCGDSVYPGGYDWYPCQHERFIKNKVGQWINNVTYCGGSADKCVTDMIVTIANVSMPAPGVVHHDYTDAPLSPQSEDWRLVSWPHPDYALMLWCGRLPVLDYAGGILISRKKTDVEMPDSVTAEFKSVLAKHGLDWEKTCPSNNDHCPF